jgi:hypothetical protein
MARLIKSKFFGKKINFGTILPHFFHGNRA